MLLIYTNHFVISQEYVSHKNELFDLTSCRRCLSSRRAHRAQTANGVMQMRSKV